MENYSKGCEDARWDIRLTGQLVTAVFGVGQWQLANPSARSMTDRPDFCRYHYYEAMDMMNEYVESKLKDTGLWGAFEDRSEFNWLMLKIRANITAFVQSLHAVADTCSHLLYYSLALDKTCSPLKERDICAREVAKILEKNQYGGVSKYDKLCELFREITSGGDYAYLNALTNISKHRSIIRSELNEDLAGRQENRWSLYLESFWYAGHFFEKVDASEFMLKEHDRIQYLTVHIGVELNNILKRLRAA